MILDGKQIAADIKKRIQNKIASNNYKIGLAFILVGEHAPSLSYVKMKKKACLEVGIESKIVKLTEPNQAELLNVIENLNQDPSIHGILLQQPLAKPLNEQILVEAINPNKDVDGFHPLNQGRVIISDPSGFTPCTPMGIIEILKASNIETQSKHVVILGRSNIVSKPLANLLLQKGPFGNATVTIAHSKTKNLKKITQQADILITAIGKSNFVTEDMIKENTVVIDVGINRLESNKIVGDVDFETVSKKCSGITPVPGGVGPMTIACLLLNTLKSYELMNP